MVIRPGFHGGMTEVSALPTARVSSFVVTPAVVAHRGASGYRPEHTLGAYRLAVAMGADDIELDVVPTRDGVLVARHDNELGRTTDVADHPEFAGRRTTRVIDGESVTGWFVEDFLVEELRSLTARERHPRTRWQSAAHDGRHGLATLDEILAMVAVESERRGRAIGVLIELKHATYFDAAGLPLDAPLLDALRRHDLDHPRSRVSVLSFEATILRRLAGRTRVPLVQLLGKGRGRPADLVAAGDARTYADLASPAGLATIQEYADGVGVHRDRVLKPGRGGTLTPTSLVSDAHREWLTVHVWTLRAENRHLSKPFRVGGDPSAHGDLAGEARLLLDLGVDGLITDHPDVVVGARGARAQASGSSSQATTYATMKVPKPKAAPSTVTSRTSVTSMPR
ncbi:MAG: glpQ [Nocardioides sp.]|nr:glpQ [Nocardioides sp.]